MVKTEQNFLSFQIFKRFEIDIRYGVPDASLDSKIEKSEAFRRIAKQGKLIFPLISEFLSSDSRLNTEAHFYTLELPPAWIKLIDKIAMEEGINIRPALTDHFIKWLKWLSQHQYFQYKIAEKEKNMIILNVSDAACLPLGFRHKEVLINPSDNIIEIAGAGPGKDGLDVLWYILQHPSIKKNEVCYWPWARNLVEAKFKKFENPQIL